MSAEKVAQNSEIGEDIRTIKVNEAAVTIVQAYLDYAGKIIVEAMNKQNYSSTFKEINDELVIKPNELVDLINSVQRALVSIRD